MSGLKTNISKGVICSVAVIISIVASKYSNEIRISNEGLEIIGNAEGCIRSPYNCPAGLLTDGIGNTNSVTGKEKSDEQIAYDWKENIKLAELCVNNNAKGKALPQPVFDVAVSMVFNMGCGYMKGTTFFKLLNEKRYSDACEQVKRFIYVKGVKSSGLIKRREVEYNRCIKWEQTR